MRILVLVANQQSAAAEVMPNHGPDVVININPLRVRKGETEVSYFSVKNERDVDRLRGMRFDLIIEDGSFNPERSWGKGALIDLVRQMVLR